MDPREPSDRQSMNPNLVLRPWKQPVVRVRIPEDILARVDDAKRYIFGTPAVRRVSLPPLAWKRGRSSRVQPTSDCVAPVVDVPDVPDVTDVMPTLGWLPGT